jgi:hypothetical protein
VARIEGEGSRRGDRPKHPERQEPDQRIAEQKREQPRGAHAVHREARAFEAGMGGLPTQMPGAEPEAARSDQQRQRNRHDEPVPDAQALSQAAVLQHRGPER